MRELFTKENLSLVPGQAVSGIAARAETLRVLQGRVWLTVEGVAHDYWLCAGDTFTAQPGCLVVVEADRADSRIELIAARRASVAPVLGDWLRMGAYRLLGSRQQNHAAVCATCGTTPARR